MIKEFNKNIVKCHNCSTLWTFSDEDVKEVSASNQFGDNYKEHFIKFRIHGRCRFGSGRSSC